MPFEKERPPDLFQLAIQAWNMLGGEIDWAGLPLVAELLGIADIELLIRQMMLIREFQNVNK